MRNNLISNKSSFIVFCHDNKIKVKDAKSIWYLYLKYQIPSPKKYLEKYLNVHKLTCIWYPI